MKHGKKPTVEQRKLLERNGLNWREWLFIQNQPDTAIVRHRLTGTVKVLEK